MPASAFTRLSLTLGSAITSPRTAPSPLNGSHKSVVERIGTLKTFPQLGRLGRVHGTRELAFPPLPFLAIYEIRDEQVIVLRILTDHSDGRSRRWSVLLEVLLLNSGPAVLDVARHAPVHRIGLLTGQSIGGDYRRHHPEAEASPNQIRSLLG